MYGSPGDSVIIEGSGFNSHPTVLFWNGSTGVAANYFLMGDTALKVTNVPSGILTGPISILVGTNQIYSSAVFTVVGPGPFISDFSPTVGAVSDSITISGVHFLGTTSIKFTGATVSPPYAVSGDGTSINSVFVPAGATNGPIIVTSPAGSYTSTVPFTVIGPGPYISGFSPAVGSAGGSFSIQGRHLGTATNVSVGNVSAVGLFLQGDTQIFATNGGAVQTGFISVRSPQGGYTNNTLFYIVPVVLSSFSPTNGSAGTTVTIKGQNFLGATNVQFSGVNAFFTSPTNNTNLVTTVPLGAASGLIRVTTPGSSAFSAVNFRISPLITGFSPAGGGPGTGVVISGANLNEGLTSVKFNGTNASFGSPAFGSVTVTVPTNVTTGPISLTTSNGTVTTVSNFFGAASISGFTPTNSAPGSFVTITGINFSGATAVAFNGKPAATNNVINNTTIGAVVPVGVSTGPITVTTPAGTVSSGSQLFYGAPVISSFLPIHGLPGTNVTILGTNFLGATAVRFNNLDAATFNVVDNGTIQAVVPNSATTGPISVTAPAGIATSAGNFTLDFASDVAVLLTASPDPVFAGSNLVYTIVLTNNGPFAAPNVFLTNTLPDTVQISSATTSSGSLNANGNPIIGMFGTLGIGSGAVVTLNVIPQSVGTITNRVLIVSDYPDPVPGNNSATLTTTVAAVPALSIGFYSTSPPIPLLRISWPASLTNYVLQFNTVLSTNVPWSNFITTPDISGDQKFVIDPLVPGEKFYRLKR